MLQTPLSFLLHMDSTESNNHHFHIRGAMPVPVLEDSDNESSLSSEDTASLTELVSGQFARGAADEVKLELRNAIRSRRVAKGLDEMPNCDAKRPKIEQLSAEEEEKRRIRRERNKVAASKCRQRRKEHMTTLQLESDGLDKENSTLESEIAALKKQKEQLEEMFREHICQLKKKNNPNEDESAKSPDTCSAEASKMKDSISPCSPSVDLFSSQA